MDPWKWAEGMDSREVEMNSTVLVIHGTQRTGEKEALSSQPGTPSEQGPVHQDGKGEETT